MGSWLRVAALGVLVLGIGATSGCRPSRGKNTTSVAGSTVAEGGSGLCSNACDKYIACGGEMPRRTCVEECSFIYANDEALASLMTMQCPAYVSYIDGPAANGNAK